MHARILEYLEGRLAALLDVVANFTFRTMAVAAKACDADFCDAVRLWFAAECDAAEFFIACELYVACCVFR